MYNDVIVAEYRTGYDISIPLNDPDDEDEGNEDPEIDVPKPPKKEIVMAFDMIRQGLRFAENVLNGIVQSPHKCEHFNELTVSKFAQQYSQNYFYYKSIKYCTVRYYSCTFR